MPNTHTPRSPRLVAACTRRQLHQARADASARSHIHAQLFQALRFTVGALFLAALYRRRGVVAIRKHLTGSCVVGALLASGYLLQTLALSRTTLTRNAFLTALCVPLTPLLLPFFTRAAPTLPSALAAAMAAVGTWLLTGGGGGGASWGAGDDLMIGCAVLFALHFIALNHFCTRAPDAPDAVAVGQMVVGALISWAFVPLDLLGGLYVRVTPSLVAGVLATGLFATGAAFALLSWAQRHVSASRTAVICATEPLFAALAAYILLGEGLGAAPLGGGAIILASIVVSSAEDTAAARRALRAWCAGAAHEEAAGGDAASTEQVQHNAAAATVVDGDVAPARAEAEQA